MPDLQKWSLVEYDTDPCSLLFSITCCCLYECPCKTKTRKNYFSEWETSKFVRRAVRLNIGISGSVDGKTEHENQQNHCNGGLLTAT